MADKTEDNDGFSLLQIIDNLTIFRPAVVAAPPVAAAPAPRVVTGDRLPLPKCSFLLISPQNLSAPILSSFQVLLPQHRLCW